MHRFTITGNGPDEEQRFDRPLYVQMVGRGTRKKPSWFRQLYKTIRYARGYDASWRTVVKILWRKLWTRKST
jgi:hypothetical protein